MIIYSSTKSAFLNSVLDDTIDHEISEGWRKRIGKPPGREVEAWRNSMAYMGKVLNTPDIPDNAGVAIEFRIPSTSKRIDFLISGIGDDGNANVIVIELKQWSEIELVTGKDAIIRTPLGKGWHDTTHPSYQAWSYQMLIEDYNATVQEESIGIQPCAYLHNLDENLFPDIRHDVYQPIIRKAPVFSRGDAKKLREFIKRFIKIGDDRGTLYRIDNGRALVRDPEELLEGPRVQGVGLVL